jgi:hypothetical protein
MLAAAPATEDRILELFRLALGIAGSNNVVPPQLVQYFNKVLSQARALDKDPTVQPTEVLPESVQLALDLRERAALRDAVTEIRSLSDLTPARAADVLRRLEEVGAPRD